MSTVDRSQAPRLRQRRRRWPPKVAFAFCSNSPAADNKNIIGAFQSAGGRFNIFFWDVSKVNVLNMSAPSPPHSRSDYLLLKGLSLMRLVGRVHASASCLTNASLSERHNQDERVGRPFCFFWGEEAYLQKLESPKNSAGLNILVGSLGDCRPQPCPAESTEEL